jgi:hypothetical protein
MKTENVSLNSCDAKIWHSESYKVDSLHIELKVHDLSHIQRLIGICGGTLTVFSTIINPDVAEPETIYWVRWSSHGNAYLSSNLNISKESHNLLVAGFGGNNEVHFWGKTELVMVDNSYFILPDDTTLFSKNYSAGRSSVIQLRG